MSTQLWLERYHSVMAAELVQKPESPLLTVQDRCDRCGAQAYVSAMSDQWANVLLFCAHHGREHTPALLEIDHVWVHDESDRLHENVAEQKLAKDAV
jgi:hypothetical protein